MLDDIIHLWIGIKGERNIDRGNLFYEKGEFIRGNYESCNCSSY